ncbi:hypothetical protein D3C74_375180 [compost metagenome]
MSQDTIDSDIFFLGQNVHSDLQRGKSGIQMRPHEISQIEPALRRADKQRPALLDSSDILTGEIPVAQQAPAIGVRFQRFIEHHTE